MNDLSQRIEAVVGRAIAERRLVGAVVMVARHNGARLAHAAGWADREALRPMRVDTPFRLASLTKPIVSAAALALVAQGRLALDDAVLRWLPEFRPALPDGTRTRIRVEQLLTHQAGLGYRFMEPNARGPYARAGVSDGFDRSGLSLIENVRRLASVPLLDAPGTAWRYSLATDVLGAVIERVTERALGDAVRALVTAPLEMHRTGFVAEVAAGLAVPYVNVDPDGASPPRRLDEREVVSHADGAIGIAFEPARATDAREYPSGGAGMVGCADEFLRLLEALRGGGAPILPAAWVDELGRDRLGGVPMPQAPGQGFGLGFAVLRDPVAAGSPHAPGTWSWGGAYGHSWFVDRRAGISAVALTNTLYEGMSGRFVAELGRAIAGAAGRS